MNRQLSFGFFFLISAIVLDIYVIYLIIFFCVYFMFIQFWTQNFDKAIIWISVSL